MAEQANNCCVIEHLIRIDAGVSGIGANMKSVHHQSTYCSKIRSNEKSMCIISCEQ